MKPAHHGAAAALLAGLVAGSCATKVPAAAVAWSPSATVISPSVAPSSSGSRGAGDGFLRVETDTDIRVSGSLSYDSVRRGYDLYDPAGKLLRADVPNQGWRSGADPVSLPLPAGRYVVASMYGTTYRKVQVEIVSGATTEVPAEALSRAPAVFR
jgi:hypothetical protein